jgi:hypothetical protein
MLTSDANNCMNYEYCKLKSIFVQAMKLQHEKKESKLKYLILNLNAMPTSIIKNLNYWKVQMKIQMKLNNMKSKNPKNMNLKS